MKKIKRFPEYLEKNQNEKLLQEIRYGLLLDEMPAQYDDDCKLPVFEQIDQLYQQLYREAGQGCYFCDPHIDANKYEFNKNTYLCIECQIKLANFITAINLNPAKLLKLVDGPRKVQKTRLNLR